ncbi:GNAT family N-acetyltransferase [Longispora sp. NPDC051575]|uniref:GNAT family N-acetyltransferase n=1 Tax=Longispora sp. NPDC051575 TaxID=3154943 RepID=UPI00341CF915
MRITELLTPGPQLDALYEEVLVPSFPAAELSSRAGITALVGSGRGPVWIATDDAGTVLGGAVGDWEPGPRVLLLSWLAVRPGHRGGRVGGPLLDAALAAWRAEYEPCLILAEVEDPTLHTGNEQHGYADARLRFYQRRGARALDVPYFQPALGPEGARVPGLLLLVLHADPEFAGAEPDTINADVLRDYIEIYQRECEGDVQSDDQAMELWRALDRPGGVRLH